MNTTLPSEQVLVQATKLAILNDKPIMLDYWTNSLEGSDPRVMIGFDKKGDKFLVKSSDEYTSPIAKIYKIWREYIIETENSLYIILSTIPIKKIQVDNEIEVPQKNKSITKYEPDHEIESESNEEEDTASISDSDSENGPLYDYDYST
jgi:hypothetical protein